MFVSGIARGPSSDSQRNFRSQECVNKLASLSAGIIFKRSKNRNAFEKIAFECSHRRDGFVSLIAIVIIVDDVDATLVVYVVAVDVDDVANVVVRPRSATKWTKPQSGKIS